MIQKMPSHGDAWKNSVNNFKPEEIDKLVKKDKEGYIFQFDVEYFKELRKKHNKLSFKRRY